MQKVSKNNSNIPTMKKRIFIIALFILSVFQVSAQNSDEVTLVVSADGVTKEEATKIALRSAIEQAYGAFISANTTILNDELVKDEIVTISNGNIKSYKEIANEDLPNGNIFVSLQVTVSINKLVSYAQSKGVETEFAGATFAMNLKMEELNKRNEEKIIADMFDVMERLYMTGIDYKISVDNPKATGQITANIDIIPNNNAVKACDLFYKTLQSLSLPKKKIKEYEEIGKDVFNIGFYSIVSSKGQGIYRHEKYKRAEGFSFRSENTIAQFDKFFNYTYPRAILNVCIKTDAADSQIEIISSYGVVTSSSDYGRCNNKHYGEDADTKVIFDKSVPALASGLNGGLWGTDYWKKYVARERLLNYIQSIEDIEKYCYFFIPEDVSAYHITDKGIVVGYPQHKVGAAMHRIQLILQIPQDDLMKISKFTISNGNE